MIKSTSSQFGPALPEADAARSEKLAETATSSRGHVQGVSSEELLGARGELKIQHNGEWYSLRRTRQGKLILTK